MTAPTFARGTVRARMLGNGFIRIEGSVTSSKRIKGIRMHPNTARALAGWLLTVTVAHPNCSCIVEGKPACTDGAADNSDVVVEC